MAQTPGWPGTRRSGSDDDAAAAPLRDAEGGGQRVRLHAGGPHERLAREHLAVGERDRVGATDATWAPSRTSTPRDRRVSRAWRRLGAVNGCKQVVLHLDEHDAGSAHVEARVVLAEDHGEQLGERAGRLDAGRSAADDDEGEPTAVDLRRVEVGGLEALEHVVPQRGWRPPACRAGSRARRRRGVPN